MEAVSEAEKLGHARAVIQGGRERAATARGEHDCEYEAFDKDILKGSTFDLLHNCAIRCVNLAWLSHAQRLFADFYQQFFI